MLAILGRRIDNPHVRALRTVVDPMHPAVLTVTQLQGAAAPNVIPDHAMAEVFIRLVDDGADTRSLTCSITRAPALSTT